MTKDNVPSAEWSQESVRRQLKSSGRAEGADAQVFFRGTVTAGQLREAAQQAIDEAAARLGVAADVKVRRVTPLALSVSVCGDADVIAEMMNCEEVCAVLPSEIADIYPKPLDPPA